MKNLKAFFSKKTITPVLIISFLIGVVGGTGGSYTYFRYQDKINSSLGSQFTVNEDSAVVNAVKKAEPAVVSITGSTNTTDFFGNRRAETAGTGFIIDKNGLILTNKHVVSNSEATFTVYTSNGKKYSAKVKSADRDNDLALLKVDAKNLPTVPMGNSDRLELGQRVIAIGNALGQYDNTVTTGIISGLERSIQAGDLRRTETLKNVIQTDAVINQGNSGGPLINLDGQVIGINTATDAQGEAISFAIPVNEARSFIGKTSLFNF
jgi:serine protease Do